MSSLVWLGVAVVFVLAVVLTGRAPKGGKPVERTRLMGAARSALIVGVLICGALGLWGMLQH